LQKEYGYLRDTLGFTHRELFDLSRDGIECIFGGEDIKLELRKIWDEFELVEFK
jgi:hypothetical protein